ncbi:MAG: aminodeoxychorismate synthase component I, partial [Vibrio sp.]
MNNNQILSIEHKQLTYHPDIAKQFFTHIEQQPWAMLLRSASTTHMDSRFDILVANPLATLVTFGDETKISTQNGVTSSREDPFTLLAQAQQH